MKFAFLADGKRVVRGILSAVALGGAAMVTPQQVLAETFGDWRVDCQEQQCQAVQQLFVGEGEKRSRVLSASIIKPQGKMLLQMVLPLGVDLRPGIVTRIDESEEQHFAFTTCVTDGCVALVALNDGMLAGMKAGKTMKIGFRPFSSEQTLVVELSLSGFTKASSKVR
ncbi:invasion associated locus B family protein [Marinobacterium sediminicola]|uniref:Invasion protein IalB, involved in pathogenesis n=1 Tax=Marinobacterium sediminicola TaxID=518898 RepID=A0ABY1S0D6_9GAMM|nr:invasion associated locus B family protein [Marinobacterium sediminicola]ULG68286.1 invasion associated locus B family protein [Marinobacterium sediminicola]SMR74537.1 Invasion protein IalB, involved in pathogenesis [Marinobacterium sediminicola]